MLEALIRKESLPQSDKCAGDVICVKLKGHSDWGAMEKRVHAVVDWQDDNLEQKLLSSLNENTPESGLSLSGKNFPILSVYSKLGVSRY